jgi:hypothetical protein
MDSICLNQFDLSDWFLDFWIDFDELLKVKWDKIDDMTKSQNAKMPNAEMIR